MNILRSLLLAVTMTRIGLPANLAVSTYLKDGFTPAAIASDLQGNIYLAGSAVLGAASQTSGAVVAKLDPKVAKYLYLTYFDSGASDQISAMAVDSSGNAYITGWTTNPNFPIFGGGALGAAPTSSADPRSFVAKLNPQGVVVISVLIGGSATSMARGIALTPQGQILVSGIAASNGMPTTAGAYSVADSTKQWFLMELDPTANRMIFSATGIGGSSITLDATGNIYLAGSSPGTNYPTTPGAYQTTFSQGFYCFGFCRLGFFGNLQHVTKVDPAASRLIYSTGINDLRGRAGSTTNTGLAVDAAGNAYVTGTLLQSEYPFTVMPPGNTRVTSYLTKLDPSGAKVLFSAPIGGGGVHLDSSAAVYVGGTVSNIEPFFLSPNPPSTALPSVFSWIPPECLPNNITTVSAAYALKVDPVTGEVQDGQWIDGSEPGATAITLSGGKVWITGTTLGPDVPFSPGVLSPTHLGAGVLEGAYLSAVDFSGGVKTGPAIACVLDSGNLTHAGAIAGNRLISIFGANLGPAAGLASPDGGDTSISGVSATFDGTPARLLYVSSSQINLAAPPPRLPSSGNVLAPAVMQLNVNGASISRQFAYTSSTLNLFADLFKKSSSCPDPGDSPLATNSDGSINSCANPARSRSTISFYVHGAGGFGPPFPQALGLQVSFGSCSAAVTNSSLIGGYVHKVDVSLPASTAFCLGLPGSALVVPNYLPVTFSHNNMPVGPLSVPVNLDGTLPNVPPPGYPRQMYVWIENGDFLP